MSLEAISSKVLQDASVTLSEVQIPIWVIKSKVEMLAPIFWSSVLPGQGSNYQPVKRQINHQQSDKN